MGLRANKKNLIHWEAAKSFFIRNKSIIQHHLKFKKKLLINLYFNKEDKMSQGPALIQAEGRKRPAKTLSCDILTKYTENNRIQILFVFYKTKEANFI